jgi:hypothetical protein
MFLRFVRAGSGRRVGDLAGSPRRGEEPSYHCECLSRHRGCFGVKFVVFDLQSVVVVSQGFLHGLKKKDAVVDGDHGVALDEVGPGLFDALFASLSMILVSEVLLSGVNCENGLSVIAVLH